MQSETDVVFRFRRPTGVPRKEPSKAMSEALRRLSEAEEMQPLITSARVQRRKVVLEVFHSAAGHPLLIHVAASPKKRA